MTDRNEDDKSPRHEDDDFVTGSHFAKVYASILDSSVWSEAPAVRLVWLTLLLMCDSEGFVEASATGIIRRANVPMIEGREALKTLEAPDLESKSQEWGGRRIEKVERGWKILNYEKYRNAQTAKQKAAAERQARFREKRAAEVEWLKLHPGQPLPADWDENWEALRNAAVTPSNAQKEREREKVEVEVDSSSSTGGSTADVENSVDKWTTPTERRIAEALPSELDRNALLAVLEAAPNRPAWAAECGARLDGMHPPTLTGAQLGEALRDYVGNGSIRNPSFKHFRAYLARPDRPKEGAEGSGQPGTLGQAGSGATGEAGAILARLKSGSLVGEPADVRQALEALGGLGAVKECKPERWGLLVKDFVAHLAFARANPRPTPEPAAPTAAPIPEAQESPAMRRAREAEEKWLAENPGQPLPKDFHMKRPPKKPGE